MGIPQIRSVGSSSGTVNNLGRNDLQVGETVTLSDTNSANTGHPHSWALLDRPIGSSTVLATPSGATATFVPDVTGSYFIRCTVDGVSIREVVIAVPLPVSGARMPAFTEQLQYDGGSNTKGWHEALTAFLRATDAARGLRETSGPTVLIMGAIADGKVLARSGSSIVGVNGGHIIEDDTTPVPTRSSLNFKGALVAVDAGSGPDRIDVDVETNGIADAMLRQSVALSLIGRSANSTGNPADISTTSGSGAVLRESGGTLGFGTVTTAGLAANAVTDAVIRQAAALSVIGRGGNSTGNVADISVAAGSGLVLRESGNVLSFGTVGSSGLAAYSVINGKIRQGAARSIIGNATAATADVDDIVAVSASDAVLRESGGVIGFGTITTGGLANLAVTTAKLALLSVDSTILAANAVTTAKITDANITYAKIQNGAALSILGRSANSSGVLADISTTNASDAVLRESGGVVGFGTVATGGLANLAVTAAKIANATITATQIANATITTALLAANCVDNTILRQGAARTVIGRSANSTGNVADIAGAGANTYLSDDGTTLAFRSVSFISQAYATVQANASSLTQRAILNFGTDFTPSDNAGSTRTDVVLATQGGLSAGTYTSSTVTVNSKGVVTAIASGSAVSITGSPLTYSIVDVANAGFASVSNASGNQTTGAAFYSQTAMTCTGVRFYWKRNATNRTFNVAIWSIDSNSTGTKLANIDVAVTATGVYVGTFGTPVSLAANSRWMVSVWEKSGAEYVAGGHSVATPYDACIVGYNTALANADRTGQMVGPYLFHFGYFVAGANTFPGTATPSALGDRYYPVEPILNTVTL